MPLVENDGQRRVDVTPEDHVVEPEPTVEPDLDDEPEPSVFDEPNPAVDPVPADELEPEAADELDPVDDRDLDAEPEAAPTIEPAADQQRPASTMLDHLLSAGVTHIARVEVGDVVGVVLLPEEPEYYCTLTLRGRVLPLGHDVVMPIRYWWPPRPGDDPSYLDEVWRGLSAIVSKSLNILEYYRVEVSSEPILLEEPPDSLTISMKWMDYPGVIAAVLHMFYAERPGAGEDGRQREFPFKIQHGRLPSRKPQWGWVHEREKRGNYLEKLHKFIDEASVSGVSQAEIYLQVMHACARFVTGGGAYHEDFYLQGEVPEPFRCLPRERADS